MLRPVGKRPGLFGLALIGAAVAGCAAGRRPEAVELSELKAAPWRAVTPLGRFVVTDPRALEPLYRPIARRLGVVEIRSPADWQRLRSAVPQLGPCPELGRGIVIGLVGPTGTALGRSWPLRLVGVREAGGAGLVEAQFDGGAYLADDVTYIELAQVDGVRFVAAVGVDGLSYTR